MFPSEQSRSITMHQSALMKMNQSALAVDSTQALPMRFRIASSSDGCGLDCQVASGTRKRSKLGTLLDACAAGFSTYGDGRGRRSGQLSERGHLVPQWPKGSLMAAVHAMDPKPNDPEANLSNPRRENSDAPKFAGGSPTTLDP